LGGGQEIRGKRQEVRGKRQEVRGKRQDRLVGILREVVIKQQDKWSKRPVGFFLPTFGAGQT